MHRPFLPNVPTLAALSLALLAPACTLISVDQREGPPGVRAEGVVDGHAVFGWRSEHSFLRAELFDGTSGGALFELSLWKLLRLEAGLAGACLGLGPIDLGLGTLFFEPVVPPMMRESSAEPAEPAPAPATGETTATTTVGG